MTTQPQERDIALAYEWLHARADWDADIGDIVRTILHMLRAQQSEGQAKVVEGLRMQCIESFPQEGEDGCNLCRSRWTRGTPELHNAGCWGEPDKGTSAMANQALEALTRSICQKSGLCKYVGGRCNTSRCTIDPEAVRAALTPPRQTEEKTHE